MAILKFHKTILTGQGNNFLFENILNNVSNLILKYRKNFSLDLFKVLKIYFYPQLKFDIDRTIKKSFIAV